MRKSNLPSASEPSRAVSVDTLCIPHTAVYKALQTSTFCKKHTVNCAADSATMPCFCGGKYTQAGCLNSSYLEHCGSTKITCYLSPLQPESEETKSSVLIHARVERHRVTRLQPPVCSHSHTHGKQRSQHNAPPEPTEQLQRCCLNVMLVGWTASWQRHRERERERERGGPSEKDQIAGSCLSMSSWFKAAEDEPDPFRAGERRSERWDFKEPLINLY